MDIFASPVDRFVKMTTGNGVAASDLDAWLVSFLDVMACKTRQTWAPFYLRGLRARMFAIVCGYEEADNAWVRRAKAQAPGLPARPRSAMAPSPGFASAGRTTGTATRVRIARRRRSRFVPRRRTQPSARRTLTAGASPGTTPSRHP